jgi:two-component system LytT family response regulator
MNLAAPLRVIIVEDMIAIRQDIEDLLRKQPGFTVTGVCGTVYEAVELINDTKPDLLLLDIGLPDGTGFDILEQITVQTKVIFLTAHEEYVLKAIRYGAIDYLLKPLAENEFREALQRVISAQPLLKEQIAITVHSFRKKTLHDFIALKAINCAEIVVVKDICYIQGDNGYTTVFLNGAKPVVTTMNLKEHEELLPDTSFLRTHQSYLVNKLYIRRYHKKEGVLCLKDGTQIPVSFRKRDFVDKYFKNL